ncbi:protein dead ringer isoform X2 [Dendroctonus ponderosae]|uniref:protein dead ringer isoform X2 n=1 Tax=Dendroctonus ponderosae TaxID=77166 RepID=UPI002034C521|nr:protein dead ringer isoform X2 [Dendroctonus ponderosae]
MEAEDRPGGDMDGDSQMVRIASDLKIIIEALHRSYPQTILPADTWINNRKMSNIDDISDGEPHSGTEQDQESCDELTRNGILADHNDVLTKLKMQVRDIHGVVSNGLGSTYLKQDDYVQKPRNQPTFLIDHRPTEGEQFPAPFNFSHPASAFLPPVAPPNQRPSSESSHSSEESATSQQTWSFEEQFKQVRQLYELSTDPQRKIMLDDLFLFMHRRGTPINRLPIMAKTVLDLFELYNLVVARGGLVDVINKKLWQEIIKGLHLPSSITSAAFTLRTQYMKYLYMYECNKHNLSTTSELQTAIEGNKREGRRSNYGPIDNFKYHQEATNSQQTFNGLSLAAQSQMQSRLNMLPAGIAMHNGMSHSVNSQPMPIIQNGICIAQHLSEYMKLFNGQMFPQADMQAIALNNSVPAQYQRSPAREMPAIRASHRSPLRNLSNSNQSSNGVIEPQNEPINLSESAQSTKREVPEASNSQNKRVHRDHDVEDSSSSLPTHIPPQTANFKIETSVNGTTGETNIFVRMEINGTQYQGLLFPAPNSQSDEKSNN